MCVFCMIIMICSSRNCSRIKYCLRLNNIYIYIFFVLQGATIQRVMRGNWQEDMLWQLKEILLSKRMLEHHTLDSYIRTLNRC